MERRGGAQLGWLNASGPMAKLSADEKLLDFQILFLAHYTFAPHQVVRFERVRSWLKKGIRIVHTVAEYPPKIIFQSSAKAEKVLDEIHAVGFIPSGSDDQIPRREGIPVKWSPIIIGIVIWNAAFIADFSLMNVKVPGQGPFIPIGLAVYFFCSSILCHSEKYHPLIMKAGRRFGEIRPAVRLLRFVTGTMLLLTTLLYVFIHLKAPQ